MSCQIQYEELASAPSSHDSSLKLSTLGINSNSIYDIFETTSSNNNFFNSEDENYYYGYSYKNTNFEYNINNNPNTNGFADGIFVDYNDSHQNSSDSSYIKYLQNHFSQPPMNTNEEVTKPFTIKPKNFLIEKIKKSKPSKRKVTTEAKLLKQKRERTSDCGTDEDMSLISEVNQRKLKINKVKVVYSDNNTNSSEDTSTGCSHINNSSSDMNDFNNGNNDNENNSVNDNSYNLIEDSDRKKKNEVEIKNSVRFDEPFKSLKGFAYTKLVSTIIMKIEKPKNQNDKNRSLLNSKRIKNMLKNLRIHSTVDVKKSTNLLALKLKISTKNNIIDIYVNKIPKMTALLQEELKNFKDDVSNLTYKLQNDSLDNEARKTIQTDINKLHKKRKLLEFCQESTQMIDISDKNSFELNSKIFDRFFFSESLEIMNMTFLDIIKEFKKDKILVNESIKKLAKKHNYDYVRNFILILFKLESYLGTDKKRKISRDFYTIDSDELIEVFSFLNKELGL